MIPTSHPSLPVFWQKALAHAKLHQYTVMADFIIETDVPGSLDHPLAGWIQPTDWLLV